MTDDVFGGKPQDAGNDLSAWVGEGKKFTDNEAALKSVPHAQSHIAKLEEENEKLRGQVGQMEEKLENSGTSTDDVLKKIIELQQANQAKPETTGLDEAAVTKLLQAALAEKSAEDQSTANMTKAVNKLKEMFGDAAKAQEAVQLKAGELNVSVDFLKQIAANSPDALVSMFNVPKGNENPDEGNKEPNPTPPGGGGTPPGRPPAGDLKPGTHAYYQQMRRDDPKKFNDPHTLEERMIALKTDRAAYFGN